MSNPVRNRRRTTTPLDPPRAVPVRARHRSRPPKHHSLQVDGTTQSFSPQRASTRKRDFEVGYSKPPKKTRFKRGMSGNPKGRPKGTRNLGTDLAEELSRRILITEDGKRRHVSVQQAYLKNLVRRSVMGDAKAERTFIEMVFRLGLHEVEKETGTTLASEDRAILDRFVASKLKILKSKGD